ncbi:hypothetical protein CLV45_0997 [Hymenobacter chitinivorans DSM 11115]|uniref:Uncharacterized protein n=2 Tax=Hymenobacter chitinivorans TaxID=89969 RepID=A0A2M9BNR3_9BACT|nr:hypothetical protein CLV45_0997 [Hymenobacter chitinivorans DSM 11115]
MLTKQADGTFTIGSIAFPGVYLRLDGRNITERNAVGVGVVNGQFGAYAWERFRLTPAIDGTFTIESAEFPGVFLRLDGRISKEYHASGAGTANGQFGAYSWEQFRLIPDLG